MKDTNHEQSWAVVAGTPYDRGDASDGAQEIVIAQGAEEEAHRVFADTKAQANARGYAYVTLRRAGRDVETWPEATGWTV